MWVDQFVVGAACALCSGCLTNVPETRSLPPVDEEVLLAPAPGAGSSLTVRLERDGDFIVADLEWAATCRRALVTYPRTETVTRSVPNGPAAVAAGMGAVGTGTVGSLLLTHTDEFSDKETCHLDDEGNETCSSPRENATFGGLALVGTSIALATASIVTLASEPTTTSVDVTRGPPLPARILESGVACGEGPVAGLVLAVYRGHERIAVATTNEQGKVGFTVPAWAGEVLTLKAERVPPGSRTVVVGQTLAMVRRAPPAPASDW